MLYFTFLILILFAFFRTLQFIHFEYIWNSNCKLYIDTIQSIIQEINNDNDLVNTIAMQIDPLSGLGVEDIWILRMGDIKVKENNALNKILQLEKINQLIDNQIAKSNNKIKKSALQYYLKKLLSQTYNHKEITLKSYDQLKDNIVQLVNKLKSILKREFKTLVTSESRESIYYRFNIVFYRKYTYNLYKNSSFVIMLFWSIPFLFFLVGIPFVLIAFNFLKQRQPYFRTLEELIDDLNISDGAENIDLDKFTIGLVATGEQTEVSIIMENNIDYFQGKVNRTVMWILISLLSLCINLFFIYNSFFSNNFNIISLIIMLVTAGLIIILVIHYIRLYKHLRSLNPMIILKRKGLI